MATQVTIIQNMLLPSPLFDSLSHHNSSLPSLISKLNFSMTARQAAQCCSLKENAADPEMGKRAFFLGFAVALKI